MSRLLRLSRNQQDSNQQDSNQQDSNQQDSNQQDSNQQDTHHHTMMTARTGFSLPAVSMTSCCYTTGNCSAGCNTCMIIPAACS